MEHAFEHNRQLKQSQLGFRQSEIATLAAKGAFLPNLNASSSFGVNIGQTIDPFTNQFATDAIQSSNVGLSSGVTLFNGFQNHLTLRRARLGLELAATNVEIARNGVALSLASAYLNVLFQKEFLDIAKLNAEATRRQVERVKTLVDAGAAAESDLLDVLAQQANDESAAIGAENGVRGATETYLRNVLGALRNVQAGAAAVDQLITTMAAIFPAVAAASWLLMIVVNGVMAQKFLTASGKNLRPIPAYSEIEAPIWPAAVVIFGALVAIFGENSGFFGINVMLIGTIPFFFIGLAVLHSISASWPGRLFLLVGAYLFLVLLVWPAAIIALLGLIEHWVRLRERMHARRSNKGNE